MLCKKINLYTHRSLLYYKSGFPASSLRVYSVSYKSLSEAKVVGGSNPIRNYIVHSSCKQSRSNSAVAPLLKRNSVVKEPNTFYLNVDRRHLHSCIFPDKIKFGYHFRWKSTSTDQNTKLENMPGISINSEDILKNISPISISVTEKTLYIIYNDNEQTREIMTLFRNAKVVMISLFQKLSTVTYISFKYTSGFILSPPVQNRDTWICYYQVNWPEELAFAAVDFSKKSAEYKTALACLSWLKSNGRIDRKGQPIFNTLNVINGEITKIYYDNNEDAWNILKTHSHVERSLYRLCRRLKRQSNNKFVQLTPRHESAVFDEQVQWVCRYHMQWPQNILFSGRDPNMSISTKKAAATALMWLKNNETETKSVKTVRKKKAKKQRVKETSTKPVLVSHEEKRPVQEIDYVDNENTKQIVKLFAAPKNVLHNVMDVVSRETGNKLIKINPIYKLVKDGKQTVWLCSYHLHWPQEIKFCAKDSRKLLASHKAAIVALSWLKNNKAITEQGAPITYSKEEVKVITKKTLPVLSLDKSTIEKMKNIIHLHRTQIVPHIIQNKIDKVEDNSSTEEESDVITESKEISFKKSRKQKYLGLEKYLAKEKVELPIAKYKSDFINLLKDNQIVIVKGEPGCGKSTRVPQYVLEAWAKEDGLLGEPGRIAVTQPRRIAAISLAQRVAVERDEAVGNIVGYQVRLNSNFSPNTGRILYCTTGILLRHLQSDPNLTTFTHVILDEAHERDVNTDVLMNLLRSACEINPKLKVIVMSATIDTTMFSEYFNGAPVMDIPGFTYPVKQHFLDTCSKIDLSKTVSMCEGDIPTVIHEEVANVIRFIHKNKKEGAILCFLPGWEDISKIQKLLQVAGDCVVYCLHSRLQDSDQWKIFSKPPPGIRKIILATNIAETSVTIDDVVYVVDTGIHKEQRFDIVKGVNCIDNHWISKASARQRKGRAGRVQPGESFHLYSREKYQAFPDYSLPEIQRTSLTKILLDSKVFSNNMNALQFMSNLPTPPEENATLRAVDELKDLEMLDQEENLTSLGKTCAEFQLEPKLSKVLVNSVIFKCVTPIVDIITLFSAETELFASGLLRKDDIHKTKTWFCKNSDHLAMMRLFEKWLELSQEYDSYSLRKFCTDTNLLDYKMQTIEKLRKIHYDYLYNGLYDILQISDDFSDNDEMVKAVLYSGVGTVLQHRNWDIVKQKLKTNVNCLLTRNNHRATITTESVNHRKKSFPTNFLLYINETRSNIRRTTLIRECSLIPNISVLLFSNKDLDVNDISDENFSKDIESYDQVKVSIKNTNIELLCDRNQAEDLVECKNAIMSAYRYYIEQLTNSGMHNPEVNKSWNSILSLVSDILSKYRVKN